MHALAEAHVLVPGPRWPRFPRPASGLGLDPEPGQTPPPAIGHRGPRHTGQPVPSTLRELTATATLALDHIGPGALAGTLPTAAALGLVSLA